MCRVSVIIPMYNVSAYIGKCIESCISQSFKDMEIILVNDGSSDHTLEIAAGYQEKDTRILLLNQKNSGVSVARNNGIHHAHGKWILFVDGDDWLDANAVKVMYEQAEKYDCDIFIASFYDEYSDHTVKDSFFCRKELEFNNASKMELVKSCIASTSISNPVGRTNAGVPWGKLYKKEFIVKNHCRFQPGLKRMQDAIFNLEAFYTASVIVYKDMPLYHYRLQTDSATNSYSPDFDETAKKVLCAIHDFSVKYDIEKEMEPYYCAKAVKLYLETIKLKYVPGQSGMGCVKTMKSLRKLYREETYTDKFHLSTNKLLGKKHKAANLFLSAHCIFIPYIMVRISYILKQRSLYRQR